MEIQIIRKHELVTNRWAGGTTTELAIFPRGSSFAKRDFDFRISYATVETEESNFTFFEGVYRHLMILQGELQLTHHDRYEKTLKPFEQDDFSGEWKTSAKGKVMDFNLMTTGCRKGKIIPLHLKEKTNHFQLDPDELFAGFYCFNGTVSITTGSETVILNAGDHLLVKNDGKQLHFISEVKDCCDLVISLIR